MGWGGVWGEGVRSEVGRSEEWGGEECGVKE